jgi:protein-L-isoaspartate(D-aspartate) O-methyltransferase
VGSHADQLRATLVAQLLETGMVRTRPVEAAMRAVPRHVFLPGVPLRRAYANDVVQTKRDADGVPISAASQPSIVGAMLEQLDVRPGMRILEIGAGTGYNAALLSYLTGGGGEVVTVDVDEDIAAGARAALAAAGTANVTVLRGDGALGASGYAPFDRVIATVGVWDLPLAWQEQLAPGGRIVAPLRLRGGVTRSIAFQRPDGIPPGAPTALHSVSSEMCGFMPLRASIASDPRRTVPLTPSADVTLEVQQEQDADPKLLAGVLETERAHAWTGVSFADVASAEWLYLWLTCTLPGGLFGMAVRPSAAERGIIAPMFRWGAMATVAGDSLAYLTFGDGDADAPRDVGVIGHGTRGPELAEEVAQQIRVWDRDYRTKTAEFAIRPLTTAGADEHNPGEFIIRTPNNLITVSWHESLARLGRDSEELHDKAGISQRPPV